MRPVTRSSGDQDNGIYFDYEPVDPDGGEDVEFGKLCDAPHRSMRHYGIIILHHCNA